MPESDPVNGTATGTKLGVPLVLPSSPELLPPQAATVPSEHTATEKYCPAATPTTVLPASPPVMLTATGVALLVVLPIPSWPLLLLPHVATVPSEHNTTL